MTFLTQFGIKHIMENKSMQELIGKPQLGILWSRDFKRLCGNNPGTIWSRFRTVGLCI